MSLIINDDGMTKNEIDETSQKARALLINDDNNILIAYYGSVYLLQAEKQMITKHQFKQLLENCKKKQERITPNKILSF